MPSTTDRGNRIIDWKNHIVRAGMHFVDTPDNPDPIDHREHIEPWLSALVQAEHLNVLIGSGLSTATNYDRIVEFGCDNVHPSRSER